MKSIFKPALALLLLHAIALQAAMVVTNLAAGGAHTLFVKSDGSLWAMGANNSGQLGDGSFNTSTNKPEQIVPGGVTAIAAGDQHSLFLKSDGSLWAMGYNAFGQLGDGTFSVNFPYYGTNRPEQIVPGGVTAITAGSEHSLFVKSDGSLWGMGWNTEGELGDGTSNGNTNKPEQIVSNGVVAIAAGCWHSLFLKSDGSLWGMGANTHGQLGDRIDITNRPAQLIPSNVVAVAAGYLHTLFLKSDSSLWAMGYNVDGELGNGTFSSTNKPQLIVSNGVTRIAAGDSHSLFLKSDGSLWAMGNNVDGQLGNGTFNPTNRPEQVVASGVVAIAAGAGCYHSLFLKSDGSLWGMGYNGPGPLGDGFNSNYPLPEQIFPPPEPVLTCCVSSGTNLQVKATPQFGGTFVLLASTNLGQPRSQWIPFVTNSITSRPTNALSVTLTNAVKAGTAGHFFILKSQ